MRIAVFCPHFAPDVAPTGEIATTLVAEWVARGHQADVVTALPWYRDHRVIPPWRGRAWHRQRTDWGSVTRLHPCAPSDKRRIAGRAAGFVGFGTLACAAAVLSPRADVVLAMSPPLTLGPAAALAARRHRVPLIVNLQDIHPDAAIVTGAVTSQGLITALRWLEAAAYRVADCVTVLSADMAATVQARCAPPLGVQVLRNFTDLETIRPGERMNAERERLGHGPEVTVVLYAGNVGWSQPLELVVEAARRLAHRDDIAFVVNGGGTRFAEIAEAAAPLPNLLVRGYQPPDALPALLAAADVHLVLHRSGLGSVSVPSKAYTGLAAGRPVIASVDRGTELSRLLAASGGGVSVASQDLDGLVGAIEALADDPDARARHSAAGRSYAEARLGPAAVAEAYLDLFERAAARRKC